MNTYPIHPGNRLQAALVSNLSDDLFGLTVFEGFTIHNDREFDEVPKPWICVHITESVQHHPSSPVWLVRVTVSMVEDRKDANDAVAGDSRPRHELRAENLSAKLFGKWNGETIQDAINSESNGVYALKVHSFNVQNNTGENTDAMITEYSLTVICTSTEQ